MIFTIILVAVAAIIAYALLRKRTAGVPLAIGLLFLLAACAIAMYRFPPSPGQIAALFFMLGASIAMLAWGIANIIANMCIAKREFYRQVEKMTANGQKIFVALAKPRKAAYGILYGLISWDDEGAELLFNFLNNEVWAKGLKLEQFDAEHAQIGGTHVAFLLGIIRPKTIIDRILY